MRACIFFIHKYEVRAEIHINSEVCSVHTDDVRHRSTCAIPCMYVCRSVCHALSCLAALHTAKQGQPSPDLHLSQSSVFTKFFPSLTPPTSLVLVCTSLRLFCKPGSSPLLHLSLCHTSTLHLDLRTAGCLLQLCTHSSPATNANERYNTTGERSLAWLGQSIAIVCQVKHIRAPSLLK